MGLTPMTIHFLGNTLTNIYKTLHWHSLLSSVSMPRQRVMEVREGRGRDGVCSSDTSSGTQSREHSSEPLEAGRSQITNTCMQCTIEWGVGGQRGILSSSMSYPLIRGVPCGGSAGKFALPPLKPFALRDMGKKCLNELLSRVTLTSYFHYCPD